jgi:predicted transcriptional regulator
MESSLAAPQIVITVQDLTTPGTYTELELERMVWAIRYQMLYQFNRSPWVEHGYCQPITDVKLLARGETPPPGTWHAELLDTIDVEGALGFHEDQAFRKGTPGTAPEKASLRSARGFRADAPELPLMKIGVQTSKSDGVQPSEVLSHEALESAVDPRVANEADIRKYLDSTSKRWFIGEVSDAVQGRGYDVGAPEGRPCNVPEATVADFCYPAWWRQTQTRPATSFCEDAQLAGRIEPFQLAPGGYMSVAPEAEPSNWSQIFAHATPTTRRASMPRSEFVAELVAELEHCGATVQFHHHPDRRLLELLETIDRKVSDMEDVLAGIAADEAELATVVPKLVERDEAVSKKLAEFEAKAAAGEVVPTSEVEALKSGFDKSLASLKALLPAEQAPAPSGAPVELTKTGYVYTPAEGVTTDTRFTESGLETLPVAAVPAVPANPETGAPEQVEQPAKAAEPVLYFSGDANPGEANGATVPGYAEYTGPVQAVPAA